jgi:hypothetical protein
VLALLAVGFIALLRHANRMLYGAPPLEVVSGETGRWRVVPLLAGVALLLVLGLTLPAPLEALLHQVVTVVTP